MMKVCQAFSLLRVSRAVGMRAKHRVITSRASQHTCSSSPSGSLAALVCSKNQSQEAFHWVIRAADSHAEGKRVCVALRVKGRSRMGD